MVQNKIAFEKEEFFNLRPVAQSNSEAINNLLEKLITYTVRKYGIASNYQPPVSIVIGSDDK